MNELSDCATATAQGKQNQDGGQNVAEDYPPLDSSGEGEDASTLRERLQEVEKIVIKNFFGLGIQCNKNTRMASLTDSLLEDFLSMRKLCLDMVEENGRLRGKMEGLTEALAAQGRIQTVDYSKALQKGHTVEYFETAKTTEEQPTGALILTAANLKPAALENLIKRNVDPCQLGLRNVKLYRSKEEVVVSSTSAEGRNDLKST
ncbi:hypothetical protein HPB48_015884 [Haemaphysalis longicornis]|uniref:Uncharacterized protein n=1 Tax=Haemaphysalis longicornis TaxID=44386 RepID=A0A9J6FC17_HAELO|nr:hypothetical protein HPB48_015884 [Haemaphysalis longicornis]